MDTAPYIETFYRMRGTCGVMDNALTIGLIREWEDHAHTKFAKWERDLFLDLDAAFRHAHSKVVKFHSERSQVDLKDNDRKNLNGRGNPRI